MMPNFTFNDQLIKGHNSAELRRMEMFNRARREEMDAMLFDMSPRQTVRQTGARTNNSVIHKLVTGARSAIGNSLIAAGNRIHSAA